MNAIKKSAVCIPGVFVLLFFLLPTNAHAATRTISNAGGNYNATTTWVEGVVPTSADDVVATGTSGPLVVNVVSAAKTINFTNYTNTLTMNAVLTVSGNVTLVSAMTIAGASGLTVNADSTLTSNTKTWPNALTLNGSAATYTLADDWTVGGTLILGPAATTTMVINGNNIIANGSLTNNIFSTSAISGTTTIVLHGTGTWSSPNGGTLKNNLTINTVGTITLSGTVYYNTGTFTYTAGTVTTTGSTMVFSTGLTLPVGIVWNNLTLNSAATYTLSGDVTVTGTFSAGQGAGVNTTTLNGFTIFVSGNMTIGGNGGGVIVGTTNIVLNGTGTWSTGSNNGTVRNNLTINTAGTITLSGIVKYDTGTFTYTAGTMVTAGSTMTILATTTLPNGITWGNLALTGTSPVTLTADQTVTGTLTIGSASATTTINGFTIFVGGSLTFGGVNCNVTGTTNIVLNGTGNWSGGDANSRLQNNLTINTAGTITIVGTVGFNTGTLTYTAGTVVTTGSTLKIIASTTLNTNGISWNNVTLTGTSTGTLLSNLSLNGTLFVNCSFTCTLNGFTMYIGGSLTGGNSFLAGTTNLVLNGTGTWSWAAGSGSIANNLTINTAGTITISGTVRISGTLTYTAGALGMAGSTVIVLGPLPVGISIWNNLTLSGSGTYTIPAGYVVNGNLSIAVVGVPTYTLSGDINVSGSLLVGCTYTCTLNGSSVYIGGSLTVTNSFVVGTTNLVLNGTGTWSHSSGGSVANNLNINTAGTITISGTVAYDTGTLTYTAGTVVTTGSTLNVAASTTLNTAGINWNNVTLSGTSSDTLSSNLTVNGTLTVSGATTFAGTGVLVFSGTSTLAGASAMTIPTSLTLASGMARTYTGPITFNSTSGTKTLTSNAIPLASNITFDGIGGTWQLADNLSTTGTLTLTNGTFDANNKNVTAASVTSANANTRALTLGNGTWTLTGTGTVWDTSNITGLTVTPNASVIKITDATAATKTFSGGGETFATLQLTGAGTGTFVINGSNVFSTFTLDTPPHTLQFTGGTTNTACTWNLSGTTGNPNTITSTNTTGFTLVNSCAVPPPSVDYVSASYLTTSPAGTWTIGTHFVDAGNNNDLFAVIGRSCSGYLTVSTVVNGGSLTPLEAKLYIDTGGIDRDTAYILRCQTYQIAATLSSDYTTAFSGDCSAAGLVSVDRTSKTCTVTFTSVTAPAGPTPTFTPIPTPAPSPLTPSGGTLAAYGLKEGDTISASGSSDPDVYIVNVWGFKRLFLNPIIFSFYGHLGGFSAVKSVSADARLAFPTSGLFRNCETNDQAVYALDVTGEDTGTLHHVTITGDQAVAQDPDFFHKVFCINTNEFNWYPKGTDYTSVGQVPVYNR